MNFDFVEGLTEEQITELYNDILTDDKLSSYGCWCAYAKGGTDLRCEFEEKTTNRTCWYCSVSGHRGCVNYTISGYKCGVNGACYLLGLKDVTYG